MFNFYPIKVNKLKNKNDSNELTYVMNSGLHGTKKSNGEPLVEPKPEPKTDEQKYLLRLLALVSDKIRERFINFQQCFRFLDTDHSQSISINEFAMAIEHMRLKLSFEDIKKLFNYIDKKGQGEIGYEEFTMLLEERWRGIDPVETLKANLQNRKPNPMTVTTNPELSLYEDCTTSQEVFEKLEGLARNRIKVPKSVHAPNHKVASKITSSDADEFLTQSKQM
jgi:hypothetical protein